MRKLIPLFSAVFFLFMVLTPLPSIACSSDFDCFGGCNVGAKPLCAKSEFPNSFEAGTCICVRQSPSRYYQSPNYNIQQPLRETRDRRGEAFMLGLGNANTSRLGAFMDGYQKSSREMTETLLMQEQIRQLRLQNQMMQRSIQR